MVTGSNGQLGKELQRLAPSFPQFEFIFLSREDLPIHHFEMVRQYFRVYQPAFLVNCAAYTAVDRAEAEPALAFQVNAEAVGVLAAVCREQHARFIHISTDYVFDGQSAVPYTEKDPVNPQTVYGASKLEGERQALELNPDALIIRTSWVYSAFGKNFVKTMLRLLAEKDAIGVVNDQWGSPTYAADLAGAILQIIASGKWVPGIFHYANTGVASWYELALAVEALAGKGQLIHPISSAEYPTAAKRPPYSVLDTSRIREVYGLQLPDWRHSLADCMRRI